MGCERREFVGRGGVGGRGGFWFRVRGEYRIRRGGVKESGTEEGATVEEDAGIVEEGDGQRLCCLGGGRGKSSLAGVQSQEYQRDEEGPDGKLRCGACGKWVEGLLRHAFEEHIPCFVRPDSACWVCHRQYVIPSGAMRYFKESGHDGSFSGGQVGIVGRGDKKGN